MNVRSQADSCTLDQKPSDSINSRRNHLTNQMGAFKCYGSVRGTTSARSVYRKRDSGDAGNAKLAFQLR